MREIRGMGEGDWGQGERDWKGWWRLEVKGSEIEGIE